jgi:hypothetical protein
MKVIYETCFTPNWMFSSFSVCVLLTILLVVRLDALSLPSHKLFSDAGFVGNVLIAVPL